MKSTKCVQCGFVGWSDVEHCKSCGAPLGQHSSDLPLANPHYDSWDQPENQKRGMAIFSLVSGIICFLSLGLLGILAIPGIITGAVAMGRAKREPRKYGGHGMAVAGLVMCIVSLAGTVILGVIAAIAVPNLLAARRAANEGSAIRSLMTICSAEANYYNKFEEFGTLEQLAATGLIDSDIASGTRNGYTFRVVLDSTNPEAFEVFSAPVSYASTGRRSFYVDETFIIRGGDNRGGPSSKVDEALVYPGQADRRFGLNVIEPAFAEF